MTDAPTAEVLPPAGGELAELAARVLPPQPPQLAPGFARWRAAGRPPSSRNKNPKLAEEFLRRRTWKRAVKLADRIVKGETIPHHGKDWKPTEFQRMQALRWQQEDYTRWVIANKAALVDVSVGPAAIVNIQINQVVAP